LVSSKVLLVAVLVFFAVVVLDVPQYVLR